MSGPPVGGSVSTHEGFLPEIQGLRAIAVLVVLVFHLWPAALPGGYVGVDVFFVISGYLITGLLLRQVERTGRISVSGFYAKRIKRLLPAATLVLVAVATCISLLPVLRWGDTAREIAASALYVENWWLAAQAVDYLAADDVPSPLQHFWSLSVEEQYYIVWPLLFALLGAVGLVKKLGGRAAFGLIVVVVGVLSLAYSIYITPRDPGLAYFATTTRAWELALGGMLAVFTRWEHLPEVWRQSLGVLGFTMILAASFCFDGTTPFPGYLALLPTLGAAFMLASGTSQRRVSMYGLLSSRPFQYVGDLSYSLYLWHWPAVVFYKQIAGRELGLVDGLVVGAISLALAHQTKVLVEDRFRAPSFASGSRARPFMFGAACILLALWCSLAIGFQVNRHADAAAAIASETAGAAGFRPALVAARKDVPAAYAKGCHAGPRSVEPTACAMGDPGAEVRMFVAGDSHAVQWLPALEKFAVRKGWRVESYTKSACAFVDVPLSAGSGRGEYAACSEWNANLLAKIRRERPDLLLVSQSVAHRPADVPPEDREAVYDAIVEGLLRRWRTVQAEGVRVVVLADTPRLGLDVPECLSAPGASFESCSRPAGPLLSRPDPLVEAARRIGAPVVSLNDLICPDDICPPVIGDVLVWRDSHHVTATFATERADEFAARLDAAARPLLAK